MKGDYSRFEGAKLKDRLAKISRLQALPLTHKINIAKDIIIDAIGRSVNKHACLLYSGGKDSTVLLYLLKDIAPDIELFAMYNSTGLEYDGVKEFVKEQIKKANFCDLEITEIKDPFAIWRQTGYFPIFSKQSFLANREFYNIKAEPVQCCYQLKEKPCNEVLKKNNVDLVFWGNRAAESIRRKFTLANNGALFRPKKYAWLQCYPLSFFSDADILTLLKKYCPDYPFNLKRDCGCKCCAIDIAVFPNGLHHLLKADKHFFDHAIRSGLGAQILKANKIDDSPASVEDILKNNPEQFCYIKGYTKAHK